MRMRKLNYIQKIYHKNKNQELLKILKNFYHKDQAYKKTIVLFQKQIKIKLTNIVKQYHKVNKFRKIIQVYSKIYKIRIKYNCKIQNQC